MNEVLVVSGGDIFLGSNSATTQVLSPLYFVFEDEEQFLAGKKVPGMVFDSAASLPVLTVKLKKFSCKLGGYHRQSTNKMKII